MNIKSFCIKHYDDILTFAAVSAIGATAYGAAKASREIEELWPLTYSEYLEDKGVRPEQQAQAVRERFEYEKSKARVCWKSYLKVSVPVTVAVSSVLLMHSHHKKTAAVLSASLAACQKVYSEMESVTESEVGPKKFDELKSKVFSNIAESNPAIAKAAANVPEVQEGSRPQTLIYDTVSDRYFYGDLESIRRVTIKLNDMLTRGDVNWITYNDFVEDLKRESITPIDLSVTELGKCMGWESNCGDPGSSDDDYGNTMDMDRALVDPNFTYGEKDGTTYAIMNLNCMPLPPYFSI